MASLYRDKRNGTYFIIERGKWHKIGKVSRDLANRALNRFELDETYLRLGEADRLKITFADLCEEYEAKVLKHKGEKTIEIEKVYLRILIKKYGELYISKIKPADFYQWIMGKGYKPNTVRLYMNEMNQVFKYATTAGYIKSNEFAKLKRPALERLPPKNADPDVIKKVMSHMPEYQQSFFWMLYYTGMRPSEVFRLTRENINLKTGKITVIYTKTKRFRVLDINPLLKPILAEKVLKAKPMEPLFKEFQLKTAIYIASKKAGLQEAKLFAYQWRHTFATQLLKKTKNLRGLQQILGHSDIRTTTGYAWVMDDELRDMMYSVE